MQNKIIFAILVLIFSIAHAAPKKKLKDLLFRSIEKNFNPEYIEDFTTNISNDRRTINLTLFLKKSNPVDFWMQVGISHRVSKKFRSIFSYNINVCSVMGMELNKLSLVHLWLDNLLKYSNMPRECPWKKGIVYWHNLRPEKNSIPDVVQNGFYRINALFHLRDLRNELYTNLTMLVDIKMK